MWTLPYIPIHVPVMLCSEFMGVASSFPGVVPACTKSGCSIAHLGSWEGCKSSEITDIGFLTSSIDFCRCTVQAVHYTYMY